MELDFRPRLCLFAGAPNPTIFQAAAIDTSHFGASKGQPKAKPQCCELFCGGDRPSLRHSRKTGAGSAGCCPRTVLLFFEGKATIMGSDMQISFKRRQTLSSKNAQAGLLGILSGSKDWRNELTLMGSVDGLSFNQRCFEDTFAL